MVKSARAPFNRRELQAIGAFPRARDLGADGQKVFSRIQAARFLRLPLTTLRDQAKAGKIESIRVAGVELFARAELERYRARTAGGKLAARVFERLAQGASPAQLVVELELS